MMNPKILAVRGNGAKYWRVAQHTDPYSAGLTRFDGPAIVHHQTDRFFWAYNGKIIYRVNITYWCTVKEGKEKYG